MNRREFIAISAAVCAGCDHVQQDSQVNAATSQPATTEPVTDSIDAGSIEGFPPNTVSDAFRDQGFFIVHRDKQIFALSAICTHKGCKVRAQADQSFLCKCHGSTFDKDGRVTKGPATRDLPRLGVDVDSHRHVLVNLAARIPPATTPGSS